MYFLLQILLVVLPHLSNSPIVYVQELGGLCKASAAEGHPDLSANPVLALQTAVSASSKTILLTYMHCTYLGNIKQFLFMCGMFFLSNYTRWRRTWCLRVIS